MNRLKKQDKNAVEALLKRGFGVRAIERMLGISDATITRIKRSLEPRRIGRPALSKEDRASVVVRVRVTDEQYEAMQHKARLHKSLSAWIRKTLHEAARRQLKELDEKTNN